MLHEGRIPHTASERSAIERLLADHDGNATLTRRDPGDTGPLLVHIGADTYVVAASGRVKKQKAAS